MTNLPFPSGSVGTSQLSRDAPPTADRRRVSLAAAVIFALGTALNLVLNTQRTLWIDESATISATTRSFAGPVGLTELVKHIDLVHFSYYIFMHFWFELVGYSPFALRAPSAVAVGLAAALMVPLGHRIIGLRYGILSGLLLLAMPAALINATNGRSQAFQLVAAVATSLLLVVAAQSESRSPVRRITIWVAYALVMYAGIRFNLWFVFLVSAHAVTLLAYGLRKRRGQRWIVLDGTMSMSIVAAATLPFALAASSQKGQLAYYQPLSVSDAAVVFFRDMAFSATLVRQQTLLVSVAAVLCWALAVAGGLSLIRQKPAAVALLVPWLLLPAVGLYAVSELTVPAFANRFLIMSVPALALLSSAALGLLPIWPWRAVATGALIALTMFGALSWYQVRFGEPFGTDFVVAARKIASEQSTNPGESSGIILGSLRRDAIQLLIDYPAELEGVQDLSGTPPPTGSSFWSSRPPIDGAIARARSYSVVWYIGRPSGYETKLVGSGLASQGFTLTDTLRFHGAVLSQFERR